MNTKISAIILTKDENPDDLKSCINQVQSHVDEVIIIDSSNNSSAEIISNNLNAIYFKKKIGDKHINGFNDLKNFGHITSKNDWILHIDVDEIFSDSLFENIDFIIKDTEANAYSFPRINLPFYELYPDYQTRLINKTSTEWIGEIHEEINVFKEPTKIEQLNEYPIIHKSKTQCLKNEINKRWKSLNKKRNILICSLFKDSTLYIDTFLKNIENLTKYSNTKNYKIDLNFIEGNSTDDTFMKLTKWLKNFTKDQDKTNHIINKINLPSNIHRFTSLAILRNMLIKYGLKHHDYVLMIDSDTLFDSTLLHQLIESIETNQCDVIAPMPFIQNFRTHNNDYFYDTLAFIDNNNINFGHLYPYSAELTKKNLIKMTSVGTCYLARAEIFNINDFSNYNITKCYKELANKEPLTYDSINTEHHNNDNMISEQISFFKKLKKHGYQVYVDTNIKILHVNLEELGLSWH
ncbi:MAG: hypothetical protein PHP08_00085 [Candidatus Dojkabacteria bacterium]|nr:hypothetical protein [Candidatus Dojkabacteria bacterium]